MLSFGKTGEFHSILAHGEFVTEFVHGLHELILHCEIGLVAGTTVVLQGDDALGDHVGLALDLLLLLFGEVRVVVRIGKELLHLVLQVGDIHGFVTGKELICRINTHDDDITTVHLLVLGLLGVRDRRETALQT